MQIEITKQQTIFKCIPELLHRAWYFPHTGYVKIQIKELHKITAYNLYNLKVYQARLMLNSQGFGNIKRGKVPTSHIVYLNRKDQTEFPPSLRLHYSSTQAGTPERQCKHEENKIRIMWFLFPLFKISFMLIHNLYN